MRAWPAENDARPDLDVLAEGRTSADDAEEASRVVTAWAEAGCTWWLESNWEMPHHSDERMREVCLRLEAGPPTVADSIVDDRRRCVLGRRFPPSVVGGRGGA